MTNPEQIVRLRTRNGGRGSIYEANMWAQCYKPGNLTGNGVTASSGLAITVNGSASSPSIAIATTPLGYRIALDLVTTVDLTLTTPAANSKVVAIVAYTDDLAIQSVDSTVTGSPSSCGLISVDGDVAATPNAPTDSQIRNAITADGATGSQAAYAVLAYVTIAADATDISSALIRNLSASEATIISSNIDWPTVRTPLYSGDGGTAVTLIEDPSSYDYLIVDIDYGFSGSSLSFHTTQLISTDTASSGVATSASGGGYVRTAILTLTISDISLSATNRFCIELSGSSTSPAVAYRNVDCSIKRVYGIKMH